MPAQSHPDYQLESERLAYTLEVLKQYSTKIRSEKASVDQNVDYGLKHFNPDNAEQFTELSLNESIQHYLQFKLRDMDRSLQKPYFARIDFQARLEREIEKLYIGKMEMMRDEDKQMLIIDWRSPVASLYYEGRLGEAHYDCPDGRIEGEIRLKRQYMIENGLLNDIMDIDITTNDEFLQAALGSSKDNRLKDIVTTIQAEQNRVIRAPIAGALIVQGAAGGGKTTIALHRIAYLLYTYERKLLPKHIVIFAPNRFFLSYISEVLPELGVEMVKQQTFEDFALLCIGKKLKVTPASEKLALLVAGKHPDCEGIKQAATLKSSLSFQETIRRYFAYLLERMIPQKDFGVANTVIMPVERFRTLLYEEYAFLPVTKRISEIRKHLSNLLKKEKPRILDGIEAEYEREKEKLKHVMADGDERRAMILRHSNERDHLIKMVVNKSKTMVKDYVKGFANFSYLSYYAKLLGDSRLLTELAHGIFTKEECQSISRYSTFQDGTCAETEDLPALMYLKYLYEGCEEAEDIKHVVIDEAQDYSLFQFYVLKRVTKSESFSILGDLYQGIYSYKGIKDWRSVANLFSKRNQYLCLEQSYRTTVEIMEAANQVIAHFPIEQAPPAKPVIRHGQEVVYRSFASLSQTSAAIDSMIADCKKSGSKSIAVICKTQESCELHKKHLKSQVTFVSGKEKEYKGGCVLIPSYVVKGLEFDAVIVADASVENYTGAELDIKLLYIGMTRALHRLFVCSTGQPSALLKHV